MKQGNQDLFLLSLQTYVYTVGAFAEEIMKD